MKLERRLEERGGELISLSKEKKKGGGGADRTYIFKKDDKTLRGIGAGRRRNGIFFSRSSLQRWREGGRGAITRQGLFFCDDQSGKFRF